jgi:predicted O-methyltransferase YrrM
MDDSLEEYILQHIDIESQWLAELNRQTHVKMVNPRMLSGHLQGRILSMLGKMIQPKRILELGTFTGYSALCLAESLPDDGVLYTIEVNDELEEFAAAHFAKSPHGHKIRQLIGDALALIPTLDETFDIVFIDADKRDYTAYYESVFEKVRSGGYIFVDNTLWDGKVIEPVERNDLQTIGVMAFNEHIKNDMRVEKVILPLRDGLTLIRKK